MLLGENVKNNSHMSVMNDFDQLLVKTGTFSFREGSFKEHVLEINKHEPDNAFALRYFERASAFLKEIKAVRNNPVAKAV